jgi:probable phosphoglycerate mutase
MTKLILIRHGETDWNASGRLQGHRPVSLNERGHKQARAIANRLKTSTFHALYSSDLKRTLQTAEAIVGCSPCPIQTDPRLREWDLGILSGLSHAEAEAQHPQAYTIYKFNRVNESIPNGESIHSRFTRVTACLEELSSRHPHQTLVIVTHGGPLADCYRRTTHLSLDEPVGVELYNAGLNLITIDSGAWSLDTWGDIDHLKDIGSLGDWEGRK